MKKTPFNADDELREKLDIRSRLKGLSIFKLGFGFDTYELIEFILADRKKHELQARIETVVYIDSMLRFENIPLHPVQAESLKQYLRQLEAQQEEVK